MDLYIRSQDREKLFKFDGLIIYCTCEEMPSTASYEICDSFEGSIATYKSKKRALEVLDEIQEAKLGNFHYKCPSNVKVSTKEDTIVYEMPKE